MNGYILKICSTCKVEKELYDFNKSKSGKHGRQNRCKSCMKESNQLRYLESREEMLERNRIWHKENKEDIQCVVGNYLDLCEVPYGKSQKPRLQDFADNVDTFQFLNNL